MLDGNAMLCLDISLDTFTLQITLPSQLVSHRHLCQFLSMFGLCLCVCLRSQQLRYAYKMRFLEVLEAWEHFLAILGKIKHLLGDFDDLWLVSTRHLHKLLDD